MDATESNHDDIFSDNLNSLEEKSKEFDEYRSFAAETVLLGNRCVMCKRKSRNTCDNCVSMWRCIFCDLAFKGSYSKIKGHINKKHLDRVKMSCEDKQAYLDYVKLIIRWPICKYHHLCDVLA